MFESKDLADKTISLNRKVLFAKKATSRLIGKNRVKYPVKTNRKAEKKRRNFKKVSL